MTGVVRLYFLINVPRPQPRTHILRSSESSYQEAEKRAKTKQHFTSGMKSLPAEENMLEANY